MDGSVALVTGGGQGIGLAFVDVLVKNGVYVSTRDPPNKSTLVNQFEFEPISDSFPDINNR